MTAPQTARQWRVTKYRNVITVIGRLGPHRHNLLLSEQEAVDLVAALLPLLPVKPKETNQ